MSPSPTKISTPISLLAEREKELAALHNTFDDYIASSRQLEDELDAELGRLRADLASSNIANKSLKHQITQLTIQISQIENTLDKTTQNLTSETTLRRKAETDLDVASSTIRQLQATVIELQHKIEDAHEEMAFKSDDVEDLKYELRMQKKVDKRKISFLMRELTIMRRREREREGGGEAVWEDWRWSNGGEKVKDDGEVEGGGFQQVYEEDNEITVDYSQQVVDNITDQNQVLTTVNNDDDDYCDGNGATVDNIDNSDDASRTNHDDNSAVSDDDATAPVEERTVWEVIRDEFGNCHTDDDIDNDDDDEENNTKTDHEGDDYQMNNDTVMEESIQVREMRRSNNQDDDSELESIENLVNRIELDLTHDIQSVESATDDDDDDSLHVMKNLFDARYFGETSVTQEAAAGVSDDNSVSISSSQSHLEECHDKKSNDTSAPISQHATTSSSFTKPTTTTNTTIIKSNANQNTYDQTIHLLDYLSKKIDESDAQLKYAQKALAAAECDHVTTEFSLQQAERAMSDVLRNRTEDIFVVAPEEQRKGGGSGVVLGERDVNIQGTMVTTTTTTPSEKTVPRRDMKNPPGDDSFLNKSLFVTPSPVIMTPQQRRVVMTAGCGDDSSSKTSRRGSSSSSSSVSSSSSSRRKKRWSRIGRRFRTPLRKTFGANSPSLSFFL